jgi:hypothetical protein
MHGPTLPVPIFISLHFLEVGVLSDGLVHASLYHVRGSTFKPEWPRFKFSTLSRYETQRAGNWFRNRETALILSQLGGFVTGKGSVVVAQKTLCKTPE